MYYPTTDDAFILKKLSMQALNNCQQQLKGVNSSLEEELERLNIYFVRAGLKDQLEEIQDLSDRYKKLPWGRLIIKRNTERLAAEWNKNHDDHWTIKSDDYYDFLLKPTSPKYLSLVKTQNKLKSDIKTFRYLTVTLDSFIEFSLEYGIKTPLVSFSNASMLKLQSHLKGSK